MTRNGSNRGIRQISHLASVAALVIAAFFLGRYSKSIPKPEPPTSSPIGLGPAAEALQEQWLEARPTHVIQFTPRPRLPQKSGIERIEEGLKASEWEHHRRFESRALDRDWPSNIDPTYGANPFEIEPFEPTPTE